MDLLTTDVLVVGGGTGGTVAALQAARRGAKTVLVSEFPWLGGMLTSAGVSAPDGNELEAFQTGIWGAFLRELQQRQPGGLDNAWVSFFTYDPQIGAQIFADWVKECPNLHWISGLVPLEVLHRNDRVTGVRFRNLTVHAQVVLDGTELGDLLALAEIPYRWGWESQSLFHEPSAPLSLTQPTDPLYTLTQRYPVQSPTWVVVMQDYGAGETAPEIPPPPTDDPHRFLGAWEGYGPEQFLNYGRLPGNRFMINWPQQGNDYGEAIERLVASPKSRLAFLRESFWHTQSFARYIQTQLGRRYGLAPSLFPAISSTNPGGAYALHPYYRESRRVSGLVTVCEQDLLPPPNAQVAPLPIDQTGQVSAIAIGNYANDHHYPRQGEVVPHFKVHSRSFRWGGRWTGIPFSLPYHCLVPHVIDGLLVCEKNISVSHIANGSTRLQPVVMNLGQAAGMAAALCVETGCQPRDLSVPSLQEALLQEPTAPAALVPLFNLLPHHPDWLYWQRYYLAHPDQYPFSGIAEKIQKLEFVPPASPTFTGLLQTTQTQEYRFHSKEPELSHPVTLVTLNPQVNEQLQNGTTDQRLTVQGRLNHAGKWLLADSIDFA